MNSIDALATENGLIDSFIQQHAIQLFYFIGNGDEYTAKLCYWLASTLEPAYEGECTYDLVPNWNKVLSKDENKRLWTEAINKAMDHTLQILAKCSGNLLNPNSLNQVEIRNNLIFNECIGKGSYGSIYLVDGYAVKIASYEDLGLELSCLLKETTALSMLGRLRFIGISNDQYYIGMDYYPQELLYDNPVKAIRELANEVLTIHSLGIIHCDISLTNVRIDSEGYCRLIDFGSCRFTPSSNTYGFIGTDAYRDYLLMTEDSVHSFEVDIWALGIVFYILETKHSPWKLPNDVKDYAKSIEEQWESVITEASSLVKGMISLNRDERWSIDQIVKELNS